MVPAAATAGVDRAPNIAPAAGPDGAHPTTPAWTSGEHHGGDRAASGLEAAPPAGQGAPVGVPEGVIELAAERWREADELAERSGLDVAQLDDRALSRRLSAELTAPLRLEDWPPPSEPRAVGDGWLHDEIVDDDREAFEAMLAGRPTASAEGVAAACQELRWPVTPYRRLDQAAPVLCDAGPTGRRPDVSRHLDRRAGPPRIVDLSTHWAGPLATALLAEAGAEVIKIDPSCRPDGFGERPNLYRHLNGAKQRLDLDLRQLDHRRSFEALVAEADLLVESFSRRVLPNHGYGQAALAALNPRLAVLSIKAFPALGPEADWLAYGPGVHAASGLGMVSGKPRPAPVAYPDLVAGVTAYRQAIALLADGPADTAGPTADRSSGGAVGRSIRWVEVSLAGSIAPLIQRAANGGQPRPQPVEPAPQPDQRGAGHG